MDEVGTFTGDAGAWALLHSNNGLDSTESKHPKVIASRFLWEEHQDYEPFGTLLHANIKR